MSKSDDFDCNNSSANVCGSSASCIDGMVDGSNCQNQRPPPRVSQSAMCELFQSILAKTLGIDLETLKIAEREIFLKCLESDDMAGFMSVIEAVFVDIIEEFISSSGSVDVSLQVTTKFRLLPSISNENGSTSNVIHNSNQGACFTKDIMESKNLAIIVLRFLVDSHHRSAQLLEKNTYSSSLQAKQLIAEIRSQCIQFSVLLLTNAFAPQIDCLSSIISPLLPFVLNKNWPTDFIFELISSTYSEDDPDGSFSTIFKPLLYSLCSEMEQFCSFTYEKYEMPLRALTELCDIKISQNRPICNLVSTNLLFIFLPSLYLSN